MPIINADLELLVKDMHLEDMDSDTSNNNYSDAELEDYYWCDELSESEEVE